MPLFQYSKTGTSNIMTKPLLIVGSDTGVGKTVLTAALAAYWLTYRDRNSSLDTPSTSLGIYKPLQSGEGDREFYSQTFSLSQTLAEITPLYFETPIAPAIAAYKEGKAIDLGLIWQQFQKLQQQKECLLVEAMGGLGSPITDEYIEQLAPPLMISRLTSVPILGILPYIQNLSDISQLAQAASDLDIERILV